MAAIAAARRSLKARGVLDVLSHDMWMRPAALGSQPLPHACAAGNLNLSRAIGDLRYKMNNEVGGRVFCWQVAGGQSADGGILNVVCCSCHDP